MLAVLHVIYVMFVPCARVHAYMYVRIGAQLQGMRVCMQLCVCACVRVCVVRVMCSYMLVGMYAIVYVCVRVRAVCV